MLSSTAPFIINRTHTSFIWHVSRALNFCIKILFTTSPYRETLGACLIAVLLYTVGA